jgi:uncharacterized radical SAM superfamily Fe-S cluster-containing enzyme
MKLPILDPKLTILEPPPGSAGASEIFHSFSRGLCPTCKRAVDGTRIIRDGKVYLRKQCPTHGRSEAMISGDADWFLKSLTYIKEGSIPLQYSTKVDKGCPDDCGLCPDHEQHSCLPIIEITNHCNLECPICIVQNRHNYDMSKEEFGRILDGLVEKEGVLETINLSGGEPTMHPQFLELLDMARAKKEISRVSIATNGLRCATDYAFCEELARRKVYVSLQLDALSNPALRALRGAGDQRAAREKALSNLERAGVRTTIVSTVAKGVNDHLVGECIDLLYSRDFILSLTFQPAAFTGYGGEHFAPHNPLDVVTIPDIVRGAAKQTGGRLAESDFLPLPCSHPSCFGLTYLLKTVDKDGKPDFIPFPRFLELERYLEILTNRGTIRPDEDFETAIKQTIDEMWTSAGQVPDQDKIMKALRRAIFLMYPEDRALELEERLHVGESLVKTIFIHAFMDVHTFEVDRIKKCCTHYALPDGRLMPGCAYNNLYRDRDARYTGSIGTPKIWGKA